MKASYVAIALCTVLVVMLATEEVSVAAVTCNPTELSSCANAISSNTAPSNLCCTKLNQQKPCLCQYLNNPNLKQFVNSPGARNVARACGVPFPRC
ncbi:putative bifunctional inhibitor/plant lipid transfer protein/seed storage helical [Rosa chinensis]|uniref:Putative bifunctional inhibitor/plant lipid transfer protein/seed storage helical n=1 Tax=Rosa chinensis TaxID=74649 RepID=A0A2P6P243_ROSCH|nr:putative bifunctional inhibitor/plant lipid transfer protein/seed storage helical [Rosa chinensis]